MKFTKLMALALVLVMTVAVFAACGGDPADSTTPETTTETPGTTDTPVGPETTDLPDDTGDVTPETTEPESTAPTCKHSGKKTGNNKDASCTEEGYIEYKCQKCDEFYYKPIEKLAHTYGEYKSIDGAYIKKVCVVCKDSYVADEAGTVVEDSSALIFPIFSATFEGIEILDDVAKMFDGFTLTPKFANIINDPVTGEIYLNIPSGDARTTPNGCLDLADTSAQLVGKAFTLTFLARFDEAPTEMTNFLTWTVDGNDQVILSATTGNNYFDAAGEFAAKSPRKGWDSIKVEFAADGTYTVSLNDTQIATGSVVTTGSTSSFRFFDDKNQFEAYLDAIVIYN